ncbi:MAG UNVERIFIED_CONTAM: hypothetical protein LVR18_27360 [Planctomycetaceae bacterium]|jgi:hypothetical protein
MIVDSVGQLATISRMKAGLFDWMPPLPFAICDSLPRLPDTTYGIHNEVAGQLLRRLPLFCRRSTWSMCTCIGGSVPTLSFQP